MKPLSELHCGEKKGENNNKSARIDSCSHEEGDLISFLNC